MQLPNGRPFFTQKAMATDKTRIAKWISDQIWTIFKRDRAFWKAVNGICKSTDTLLTNEYYPEPLRIVQTKWQALLYRLLDVDEHPLVGRETDLGVGVRLVGDRWDEDTEAREGVDFPELARELAFDRGGVPLWQGKKQHYHLDLKAFVKFLFSILFKIMDCIFSSSYLTL